MSEAEIEKGIREGRIICQSNILLLTFATKVMQKVPQ
jgi:hypothetical protein